MPVVVPEASVARTPARSQATGMRPHAEADQPSSSPFSDLLDGAESADGAAVDPAASTTESKPTEAAPREAKAETPEAVKTADGKEAVEPPADLLLVIAMTGQQPAPEPEESQPVAVVAPQQAASDDTQSDTDPSPKTDASDDTTVVAQPVPLPDVVPVPTAVPAAAEVPAAAAPAVTPELTAVTDVKTAASPAIPAVDTLDVKIAAPIAPAAEAKPTEAKGAEAKPTETKPVETTSTETKTVETAPVETKPVGAPATEKKAKADKPAIATAKAGAAPRIATSEDATATATTTTTDTKPAADADVTGQKTADRSTEAAANAPRGDDAITDAKPTTPAAQSPQDATVNSTVLPSPVTHAAAPQAAQPAAHQAGPADVVPIAGLAVQIAAHAQIGKSHFEIRLDPPELGRIDVRLDVDSDGQVRSHLRVERAETLDLLRRDAPALERALQQAGLKTSDSALQFSLRDQSFSQNQGRDTPAMARIVVPDDKIVPAETQRHYGRLAGLGSGVDIRV